MLIGYVRVSTNDQNTELQRNALECAGCELIFEDKISGTKSDRPGLKKLLRTLSAGDTLVVWKLDRLGRSMRHLVILVEELRERGVAVPDDVRVIGFDDVEESAYMVPSLSTVNPGREAIARLAVESIIQQVESGSRAPAQTIEAPYSLSLRESSPALARA
mgnify:CR=1 FL=1